MQKLIFKAAAVTIKAARPFLLVEIPARRTNRKACGYFGFRPGHMRMIHFPAPVFGEHGIIGCIFHFDRVAENSRMLEHFFEVNEGPHPGSFL